VCIYVDFEMVASITMKTGFDPAAVLGHCQWPSLQMCAAVQPGQHDITASTLVEA
jgi:hypothetical protein